MIKIDNIIKEHNVKSVGITGHINPDGDCIGSVLALYNYISYNYPDIRVVPYLTGKPGEFSYLNGFDSIITEDDGSSPDMFVVLDCSVKERIKPFVRLFDGASVTVNIDHHIPTGEPFATYSHIDDTAPSVCEVLYGALDNAKFNKETAECLYTGLVTDTGVFKYAATRQKTMEIAGELINYGFDFSEIIDGVFYERTFTQTKALAKAIENTQLLFNGSAAYSYVSVEDMESAGVKASDLGGIVEQLRLIKGVEVAVFIYPVQDGMNKVSMRSKKYADVSKYAISKGGGGHMRAAGFSTFDGINKIKQDIEAYLEKELS